MIVVNQIAAVTEKTLKEFLRDKMVIFWTFALPIFFLIMIPLTISGLSTDISGLKGTMSLTMITLLIMTGGQADLAGSIASDSERGLYLKIASMPVRPWKEGLGRILAVLIFSFLGVILIMAIGLIYGAKFSSGFVILLESLGFLFLAFLASAGMGLIIASFVKGESAATHTGVAITLLTYFVGGMVNYSSLPPLLQAFARNHPICSANASMIFLLVGEDFVGYNLLNTSQICFTIVSSLLIFISGLLLYSKSYWRKK